MGEKKSPDQALAEIKAAADKGDFFFASDTLAAAYDNEIQRIFRALFVAKNGRAPKRNIWCSDRSMIGILFDWDPETKLYSPESHEVCRIVSSELGIELQPEDLFIEVAARLRDKESKTPKS